MSKYAPLPHFLMQSERTVQRLGFGEIERILGFKLPKSAYEHEAWWSNNATGHSHARTWIERGWRTEEVDLAGRKVTFRRLNRHPTNVTQMRDPWGCMAGTVTILADTDLTAPSGETWKTEEGRLLNE
ncbi:MAG: hypothetical protein WA776_17985 [Xanthobacteraceae bacterium]